MPKKHHKRRGGRDNDSDSDSSVDSRGNLRDLIDYDSDSERDVLYPIHPAYVCVPLKRPVRKAAIVARQQIRKHYHTDKSRKAPNPLGVTPLKPEKTVTKNTIHYPKVKHHVPVPVKKNTIHYPTVKRTLHQTVPSVTPEESEDDNDDDDDDYVDEDEEDSEDEDEEDEEDNSEEDEEDSEDEDEEDSEDEDEDDSEEHEEDEEEEEYDEEDEEDDESPPQLLQTKKGSGMGKFISSLLFGTSAMEPQKYKLKKEPEIVQKFVKLLADPNEENPIDSQICQFKQLTQEKQQQLILALENRPPISDSGIPLMLKIVGLNVSPEIKAMILSKYHALQGMDTSTNEYYKQRTWLEKVVRVPFGICKEIPVRLEEGPGPCGEFMKMARKSLDDATYGQDDPKLQIMQFISTKIANPQGKGMSLLLVGPPGIGKTTIIKNGIAKALGWPFQFISLGGDSDASTYTGHQLVYESSHCGKIVNSLVASKSMSTVILFDEVDKISQTAKGEEIMNLLIHLTDPVQNTEFEDKYLAGIPIDLSKVMFVFSANDIQKIDRVLLDRMIVIDLKGYDLAQKTVIAEQYLVPEALREVNLMDKVGISKDILTSIIQGYASEEKGVRELKRCIDQIVQKINMLRMYNSPELPFHIPQFSLPFIVKKEHITMFLKKKGVADAPPFGMYL